MILHRHGSMDVVIINSTKIKRRKREIRKTGVRIAAVSGNCCWEVRNRYAGGESRHLKTVDNHELPWDIKSLKMIACQME